MTTYSTKHVDHAVREVDATRRRFTAVASQEIVDSMGDVIIARGVDTTRFLSNPVLLANHDPTFVLGKVETLWIEPRRDGDALCFRAEVLPAGRSQRVDETWAEIEFGARSGISIGFTAKHYDGRPVREGQTGVTFHRTELMEISSVSLPACPTCLIEQRRVRGRERVPVGFASLADFLARTAVCDGHGRPVEDDVIHLDLDDLLGRKAPVMGRAEHLAYVVDDYQQRTRAERMLPAHRARLDETLARNAETVRWRIGR